MINTELLNQAGISYEAGLNRFMNDAELYEAVLTAFIGEDIPERAKAAFDAKDMEKFQNIIHEAKGSVGNAGFDRLYAEANALMKLLRSTSYTEEELTEGYERFAAEYAAAKNGIKAALGM